MTTYISLLRGINVGGKNTIKMDILRELYVNLGFSNVQSYIQSGNIIFNAESIDNQTLENKISTKITKTFELHLPVLVLTIDELKQALTNNPYTTNNLKDPAKIHLTFLSEIPDEALLKKINSDFYLPDKFIYSAKVIYNYCPNGYGNTKLNNTFFEKKLKLTATVRNFKTANELLAIAEEIAIAIT
jgi:uncharacterized protein (DUF1697 family)